MNITQRDEMIEMANEITKLKEQLSEMRADKTNLMAMAKSRCVTLEQELRAARYEAETWKRRFEESERHQAAPL